MKRNLIFYEYGSGKNIEYHKLNRSFIDKYLDIFDGQVIHYIARDKPNILINPLSENYKIVQNNRTIGESAHFENMLNELDLEEDSQTFYCHSKGVSRKTTEPLTKWIEALYRENLEKVPDLSEKLFSGIFGKLLPCPPQVTVPFHYSGTFFWFNTKEVMNRFKVIEQNRYGVESFPATIASQEECEFRYYSSEERYYLYDKKFWDKIGDKL